MQFEVRIFLHLMLCSRRDQWTGRALNSSEPDIQTIDSIKAELHRDVPNPLSFILQVTASDEHVLSERRWTGVTGPGSTSPIFEHPVGRTLSCPLPLHCTKSTEKGTLQPTGYLFPSYFRSTTSNPVVVIGRNSAERRYSKWKTETEQA